MARGKRLSLLLLAFALSVVCAREGRACSCMRTQTVLDSYEAADVVVVVRAVSLELAPKKEERKSSEVAPAAKEGERPEEPAEERRAAYGGVISTKTVVEKVYKGGLKAGDEMVFGQGGGADCIWTFNQEDVGRAYLFYLKRLGDDTVWFAGTCGRSRPVEYANDDLLYLNKLDKVRGRTRISGTLAFDDSDVTERPGVAGLKLRFSGEGKSFEVKTDEHGVYEIYDVPAGKYTVEPEVPPGWKMSPDWLGHPPGDAELREPEKTKAPPKKTSIVIEAKRHTGLDIVFEVDNVIGGKVFDTAGKPMDGVCLELLPARGDTPESFYEGDCTEQGGQFRFDEIPPGDYVLVVNREGKVTSSEPFGTFYYPNVARREEATVLHVGLGDHFENVHVYVPKMSETITVEGLFLYSDGKPVADESVEFMTEKPEGEDDDPDAQTKTDAKGHFSLKILKGQKGSLYGSMFTYLGEFENCPALESAIKKTGDTNANLKTPTVEIQGDNSLYGVELRYPFPGCKKAK